MITSHWATTLKAVGVLIILLLILLVKDHQTLLYIMIIQGQAHFLLAYYYQYKNGKTDRKYLIRYSCFFVVVFGLFFLSDKHFIFKILSATLFILHFISDELYLTQHQQDRKSVFKFLALLLLFVSLIFRGFYPESMFNIILVVVSAIFAYYLYLLYRQSQVNEEDKLFVIYTAPLLLSCIFRIETIVHNYIIFVVMVHVLNWYFHYYVKLYGSGDVLKKYLLHILVVNLLLVAAFVLYARSSYHSPVGEAILSPSYFYVWAIMHFVSTYKKEDVSFFKLFALR